MSKAEAVVILGPRAVRDVPALPIPSGPSPTAPAVRVAIVCPNCSLAMGGEAAIPFNYFRILRAQGVDAHLVAHGRNKTELMRTFGHEPDRLHLIEDSWLHRLLWKVGRMLPSEIARCTTGLAGRLYTQWRQRPILRRLVREGKVNVIHQTTPVSPAEPSVIYGLGAPVLIGPMNGDIQYPQAFQTLRNLADRAFVSSSRWLAGRLSWVLPGKHRAWMLLAANERTEAALNVYHPHLDPARLSENGVDLSFWHPPDAPRPSATAGQPVRFVFAGRLVAWKGVDLLLAAWATLPRDLPAELVIIGDGPVRRRLERRCRQLKLALPVRFAGWMAQADVAKQLPQADVLVHPSLRECGGSSVLEAMACELPVIACAWGGPADYLDETCGVLIPPTSPEQFVRELAAAITRLAQDAPLRAQLGKAARERIVANYGWGDKVHHMRKLYAAAVAATAAAPAPGAADIPAPFAELSAMASDELSRVAGE